MGCSNSTFAWARTSRRGRADECDEVTPTHTPAVESVSRRSVVWGYNTKKGWGSPRPMARPVPSPLLGCADAGISDGGAHGGGQINHSERGAMVVSLTVVRVDTALGEPYRSLDGVQISLPADGALRPDRQVLTEHNAECDWYVP